MAMAAARARQAGTELTRSSKYEALSAFLGEPETVAHLYAGHYLGGRKDIRLFPTWRRAGAVIFRQNG
jgi:hypothetical protein